MNRVEIVGQYTVDVAYDVDPGDTVQVDRQPSSLPIIPSNWISFCDAADDILRPLTLYKKYYVKVSKFWHGIFLTSFMISIFITIFMDTAWMEHMFDFAPDLVGVVFFVVPFVTLMVSTIALMVVECSFMGPHMTAFKQLDQVCIRYSVDGILYKVSYDSDRRGFGRGPRMSRYFILVHVEDNNNDVQQQSAAPANATGSTSSNNRTSAVPAVRMSDKKPGPHTAETAFQYNLFPNEESIV